MAALPGVQFASIPRQKITGYLLATGHPAGGAKAAFFRRFGFSAARWEALRDALLDHAQTAPVAGSADTPFGKKYILEGPLTAPDGRRPRVRAIWFRPHGETVPRLATAYPLPGVER